MATPFLLLMPSYNQSHYIADAVRSILAQDDPDWQLWIVDNSSDATPAVMRQFTDPRIHFHHIPERMDPGSCLNWMLERASGRDFSYVHTDNNLHVSYVRRMRAALAEHSLGLAYCNSRAINQAGRCTGIFMRGEFDLARLLSTNTLGVPFSATVELARQLGGFTVRDFADDVRFCVSAYGLARYVYLREPLLDYRLHDGSRTEEAGGHVEIQRLFVDLMPKIVPTLEQRGLRPLQVLEQAICDGMNDFELHVEDCWYRRLHRYAPAWWQGRPRLDYFFFSGLLDLPGFSLKNGRPPRRLMIRGEDGHTVMPWSIMMIKRHLFRQRRQLRQLSERPRTMLPTWACMKLGVTANSNVRIRINNLDARTLWAARQLELSLGWTPLLDIDMARKPTWLKWNTATGTEPLLDCSHGINLTAGISNAADPVQAEQTGETCNICGHAMTHAASARILGRYDIRYFTCPGCEFLRTEKPYWLEEAYSQAIAATDTGIVQRNLTISRQLTNLLPQLFADTSRFLDVAGGTGLLTRLMRDNGFDFYWEDQYCQNVLAAGFEASANAPGYQAVTAFEAIEHMEDPFEFIKSCVARSTTGTFIFTTELFESPKPRNDWWYFSWVTGQHIAFFSALTLQRIAQQLELRFMSHRGLHMMTKLPISLKTYQKLLDQDSQDLLDKTRGSRRGFTLPDHATMTRRALNPHCDDTDQTIGMNLASDLETKHTGTERNSTEMDETTRKRPRYLRQILDRWNGFTKGRIRS